MSSELRVLSAQRLRRQIDGFRGVAEPIDEPPVENVLESHISKLRRKIAPFGYAIRNERFMGYRLRAPGGEVRHG